jgi:hypothetical protein
VSKAIRWAVALPAVLVLSILVMPPGVAGSPAPPLAPHAGAGPAAGDWAQWVPINYREPGLGLGSGAPGVVSPDTELQLTLSLPFSRTQELGAVLAGLDQASSPTYRQYLTAAEFDLEFGGSSEQYDAWGQYVGSAGATHLQTFGDRATLTFEATPAVADAIFHVSIGLYHDPAGRPYYAPGTTPEVPEPLSAPGLYVDGLSSYARYVIGSDAGGRPVRPPPAPTTRTPAQVAGYPAPVTLDGVQEQFTSDYQVAYDQLSLYQQYGYPTDAVAATILWSGNYTGASPVTTPYGNLTPGEGVGPFDPNDITTFYNETLPAGEPLPTVIAAPLDGAPSPGPLASWDGTNAGFENTIDLEDLGALAPGATIYNVYGPSPTFADLDQAFAYVLSPNASAPGLANVSVISNSWGAPEINDTGWYDDLQEAQARGITVLAISGDSGDSPVSSWGIGDAFYPGSMAYDDFGDVAVGGTTNTLSGSTLSLLTQRAWYDASQPGGPVGSTGGTSALFPEPTWQSSTSASSQITDGARGVPDIAAIANNSLMTYTYEGYQFQATNASVNSDYYSSWGTSVATPVEAGIIADMDHVLEHDGSGWVGFLDPTLYPLASQEDAPLTNNATVGFYYGPAYSSILPTLPLSDVTKGGNHLYHAAAGYDLVTGWGAIDAYNLTMYYVARPSTPVPGQWLGVRAALNLTGLEVNSSYPGYGINTFFNASIQQNLVVADSLGAPIYWVQNVVYIYGVPGDWQMNFTGWLVYPWYGTEYPLTMYEYDFPETGVTEAPPVNFTFQTQILPGSGLSAQQIEFSFGTPGAPPLFLPAPGAAFVIGNFSYNYSWMGVNYSDGPFPAPYGGPGGLDPQFGLVGGPSGYIGNYGPQTSGTAALSFSFGGPYLPGLTQAFGESIDQTGEAASNLTWTQTSPGDPLMGIPSSWSAGYLDGSSEQGILESEPTSLPSTTNVTVEEQGLPDGLGWGITFAGVGEYTATAPGSLEVPLSNGTYSYAADPPAGYYATNGLGQVTVTGNGTPPLVLVSFAVEMYNVTVNETGLPYGTGWWFNASVGSFSAIAPSEIVLMLPNGSYPYTPSAGAAWAAAPPTGVLVVAGSPRLVALVFGPAARYQVTFEESGLASADNWSVTIEGQVVSGAATAPLPFDLLDGGYQYVASTTDPEFAPTGSPGSVQVLGQPITVNVSFALVTFAVTFASAGLPSGNQWTVTVDGQTPGTTTVPAGRTVLLPNGTFDYASDTSDPAYVGIDGSVTVSGAPTNVTIPFDQILFLVTFQVSGLSAPNVWSVMFNGTTDPSLPAASSASFLVANGSYSYTVGVPSGYTATPSEGTVHVAGVDQQLVIAVAPQSTGVFGVPLWGWAAVGLLVVVAVAAAWVLLRRRPVRAPPEGSANGAPPSEAPAPPTTHRRGQ